MQRIGVNRLSSPFSPPPSRLLLRPTKRLIILAKSEIRELRVDEIRRPLAGSRSNDPEKVKMLMASIAEIGLQEPIDVLEVDGIIYGFSGCHRYEAHQRLGKETIKCKVRKATRDVLMAHLR